MVGRPTGAVRPSGSFYSTDTDDDAAVAQLFHSEQAKAFSIRP